MFKYTNEGLPNKKKKSLICLHFLLEMDKARFCKITSGLVGKAYEAVGQAGASLYATVGSVSGCPAKNKDAGEGMDPEAVKELHRATDLALCATKQMPCNDLH